MKRLVRIKKEYKRAYVFQGTEFPCWITETVMSISSVPNWSVPKGPVSSAGSRFITIPAPSVVCDQNFFNPK